MSEKIYGVTESRDVICRVDIEIRDMSWRARAIIAWELLTAVWALMQPGNARVRLRVSTRSVGAHGMLA